MSQYNLMEDDNRLSSIIRDRVKLTYMIMQKEQVNLCLVEEVSNDNYFYKSINCERLQQIEVYARRYPCNNSRYRFYTSQPRHNRFLSLQPARIPSVA